MVNPEGDRDCIGRVFCAGHAGVSERTITTSFSRGHWRLIEAVSVRLPFRGSEVSDSTPPSHALASDGDMKGWRVLNIGEVEVVVRKLTYWLM